MAPEAISELIEQHKGPGAGTGKTQPPSPDQQDEQEAAPGQENQPKELSQETLEQAKAQMAAAERKSLEQVKSQLDELLEMQGLEGQATVTISKSGRVLNVRLPQDLLFGSGSAELAGEASIVLDKMAMIIDRSGQSVRVEGHTDNIPVRSGRFSSNWDLSTARATRVLMYLQELGGIPPGRLAAAGYGEFRPLTSNDTPEGRARNRRVEFVITAEDLDS